MNSTLDGKPVARLTEEEQHVFETVGRAGRRKRELYGPFGLMGLVEVWMEGFGALEGLPDVQRRRWRR